MVDPRECRLWLPKDFCECAEVAAALVGWVNVGAKSVDIVVVSGCPLPHFQNTLKIQLKEVLDAAEMSLPHMLRAERKLRVIGEYLPESASFHNSQLRSRDKAQPSGNSMAGDDNEIRESMESRCEIWVQEPCETVGRTFHEGNKLGVHPPTSSSGIASDANVWAVVSAHRSSGKSNELHRIPYLRAVSFKRCPPYVKDHVLGRALQFLMSKSLKFWTQKSSKGALISYHCLLSACIWEPSFFLCYMEFII